jgi:hypothetical protein
VPYFDLRAARFSRRQICTRAGTYLVGPLVTAIGIGCGYFLIARLELPRAAAAVPIALTLAGALLMALTNLRRALPPPRAPWIVLTALLITYLGLVAFVMPALEQKKVVDDVARVMTQQSDGSERIATYRMDRWNSAFRFYAGRHVSFLDDPAEARAFFDGRQSFFCLMRRPAFDEFVAQGVPLRIVHKEKGMWATSGRALWRKRITLTEFVLAARQ